MLCTPSHTPPRTLTQTYTNTHTSLYHSRTSTLSITPHPTPLSLLQSHPHPHQTSSSLPSLLVTAHYAAHQMWGEMGGKQVTDVSCDSAGWRGSGRRGHGAIVAVYRDL